MVLPRAGLGSIPVILPDGMHVVRLIVRCDKPAYAILKSENTVEKWEVEYTDESQTAIIATHAITAIVSPLVVGGVEFIGVDIQGDKLSFWGKHALEISLVVIGIIGVCESAFY